LALKILIENYTNMKNLFPVFILLLFLASCVGPRYSTPETKTAGIYQKYLFDTLTTESDTILNLRWWNLFNDNELNTLIEYALKNNNNVLMAAQRVEQARVILGITKADQYPSFGYSAGAARGNYSGQSVPLGNNFYANANLNWEIDFWGKYRAASESARASLASSTYGMRSVQISLISTVAQSYYLILDLQNKVLISQQTLDTRDSALHIIQQRYNAGIIPEIDLNQAQINQAIALGSVPFYQRQLALAKNALSSLMGKTPSRFNFRMNINEVRLQNKIPYGIPSQILRRRPDILASEEAYHAQFKQINIAVAQRFPSISITGLMGGASNELSILTSTGLAWNIGSGILGPLFNFGKNKRRVEMERAKAKEAYYNYNNVVLQAFREVEDALVSIETLKKEVSAREKQSIAAINAERLSKMRYDKGITSYLEVLENQRSAFNAQISLSQTKEKLLFNYIALYKALGGGWLNKEEENQGKAK